MSQEHEIARSKSKKIELIIQQLNSLPTLPAVAARLLQITVRSDTQAAEVVSLIESDPSLASKIIALSTRASCGVSKKAISVSKAVVLLGFEAVRNAVLSIKVFEALGGTQNLEGGRFDREGFWRHSLAVACASKMLCRHIDRKIDPEEAFICGLLHDLGKVALDTSLPKSFIRVVQLTESSMGNIAEIEQRVLGIDHTVAGKRLAEKWTLPESIRETIWLHNQYPTTLPDAVKNRSIVQTVHLADVLVREQRIGYSGNYYLPDSSEVIAELLHCPGEELKKVSRQLGEALSERATILGLDEISTDQLYYEALVEANRELGQLNVRLQKQYQSLQRRSVYFELLSHLSEESTTEQSVVDVCSLIAKLWLKNMGAEHCGVYALTPGEWIIEGGIQLQLDTDASVFLVDRTEDPTVGSSQSGPVDLPLGFSVAPVGESHRWFFEQVAPMFDILRTLMIPLRRGSEVVGGLLWQGNTSPASYQGEMEELQAFATGAAWAVRQAQRQEEKTRLSEQLAQTNSLLHETQRELLQKQRLAAVGEMACGAAHEVNNPLAVVVGRSQYLASSEEDSQRREVLEKIAHSGQDISQIITDLLDFAKPALPHPKPIRIEDLLRQAQEGQIPTASEESVTFENDWEESLPEVYVDGDQIVTALSGLIANAVESYQGQGGVVHFYVRYDDLEDNLVLEIVDQGCGMTDETRQKAFDPFFSAKPAGRSRGLGLSRSSRYIEENGGRIHLESELGKGSTVKVVLPVCVEPAQGDVEAATPQESVTDSVERIADSG
jgi:putative nucleotidyltransferase with HDIG domain